MDDDEYLGSLMAKVETSSVVEYSWQECVEGFKQADRDMGSAFHRKLDWMNRAADSYLAENKKMSGFVGKFANSCGISYDYSSQLNRVRNSGCNPKNFSSDALKALLSAPEELREDIVSSGKSMTSEEVQEAKRDYKAIQEEPEYADIFERVQQNEITPREAIIEKQARMPVERVYDLVDAMSAITGIAWLYVKNYKGTSEDAADVLIQEIIGVCEDGDDIDLSIAKDRIKWFLEFKEALDYAEPALREFLTEKPNLKIVK